jgi:N-acetylmuramoyl-L-alanine amidase
MKKVLGLLAVVLGFFWQMVLAAPPDIFVAYPSNKYTVPYDHVLLEGSVTPGADLTINGTKIDVGEDGLFIEWYGLQPGLNVLQMKTTKGGESGALTYEITSNPPKALPETPTTIVAASLVPAADVAFYTFENGMIKVSFKGSPKGAANFTIGSKGPFLMLERDPVNFPGFSPLQLDQQTRGLYEGTYVLQPGDAFDANEIKVMLKGVDGNTVTESAKGKLTVKALNQPRVGIFTGQPLPGISSGNDVGRNAVGAAYVIYPREGTKFAVIGEDNNTYRCRIAPGQHVYIRKDRMKLLPEGAPVPNLLFSTIRTRRTASGTVNGTVSNTVSGTQVRFELPDRAPFALDHNNATQTLEVKFFYTVGDVDYIVSANPDPLIEDIRWFQSADTVFTAKIDLKQKQLWGYKTFYDGNTFVLELRDAPKINKAKPLEGQIITVDAGHGGDDNGGAGSLRVPEKGINLAIAKELQKALQAKGAKVIMTRDTDVLIDLFERSNIADKANSSVFVSIHGNAIPDGVDPRVPKGFGAYYFQPQARALAQNIQDAVRTQVPDLGDDGTHYQNLAVTRPTQMPQVLLETGFLTNKDNLRFIMNPVGQARIAQAITAGLERFYATRE